MIQDTVHLLIVDQAALPGPCELCADSRDPLSAIVIIEHTRGGQVRFAACARCTRAARRLASAVGGSGPGASAVIDAVVDAPPGPMPTAPPVSTPPSRAHLILESEHRVCDAAATPYIVRVYGTERTDGTWIGWLEFVAQGAARVLRTERETTQSNREGLGYWAAGLEPAYFEGAFARAR